MNDKKINELIKPIIDIYDNLELEIVKDIANRFDNYDTLGGTLEWRLKKLDELRTFSNDMVELISEYTNKSKKEILQMLEEAQENTFNIDYLNKAYENGMIKVNPMKVLKSPAFENIISNSYKELNKTFRMINTKALENVNQSYMDIINTAYVEVASGVFDYQSSIKRALNKMAEKGIKCASYERKDGTIVKYSLQGTIKRDIVTAIIQTACRSSMKMCEELDAEYVEVTSHLGARTGDGVNPITNHAHWQGKVYKLEGSDKYDNFYTETGYGDILGLGGVNCRHNFYPYFPGIDEPSQIQYDEEENRKEYERQQKENRLNRKKQQQKRIKEVAIHNEDKEKIKETNKNIKKIDSEINDINTNYSDITKELFGNATPNSHKVQDRQYFEKDNIKYQVDGKNVVLDYSKKEKEIAEWLENTLGGELYMLPRINNPEGIQTADYLFRGECWDLKEITSKSKQALYHSVYKKKKQSNNFIFDITNSDLTLNNIKQQIGNLYKRKDCTFINKIIIKKNNDSLIYKRK